MKAVCTILGWWTAAAAAAGGAGIELEFDAGCSADAALPAAPVVGDAVEAGADGGAEPLAFAPLEPASPGLLLGSGMLEDLGGELMSMGWSVGDGADIWIRGVGIGTTRAGPESWAGSATMWFRWEASVAAAMDTVERTPSVGRRWSVLVAIALWFPASRSAVCDIFLLFSLFAVGLVGRDSGAGGPRQSAEMAKLATGRGRLKGTEGMWREGRGLPHRFDVVWKGAFGI